MKERMRNWMQDIQEMKNEIQLASASQTGTSTERKKVEEKMAKKDEENKREIKKNLKKSKEWYTSAGIG